MMAMRSLLKLKWAADVFSAILISPLLSIPMNALIFFRLKMRIRNGAKKHLLYAIASVIPLAYK